jgi:hypothetical protein
MFVSRTLTLYFFFRVAFAQTSPVVSWAYPQIFVDTPSTVTINVVDTIVVEWTGDIQTAYLWIWCNIGTPSNDRCTTNIFPIRVGFSNTHAKGATLMLQATQAVYSAQVMLGRTVKYKIGRILSTAILISTSKMHLDKGSTGPIST